MTPALADALTHALGCRIISSRRVGGGDINDAYAVALADGTKLFVKTHRNAPNGMYRAEGRGLDWLDAAGALRVPRRHAVGDGAAPVRFLALEWIEPGPRTPDFDVRLGHGLAQLHRAGAPGFGLDHDNFIGSLPQANGPRAAWATFYGEQRLRPQLDAPAARRLLPADLQQRLLRLIERLPELVGPDEPPARLHGDLWSGNVHGDEAGHPCLIDPAVYGGHREVDLAMLQLFGAPTQSLFTAYEEVWPLAPGWRRRVPLYQLYPLLVHVNLFGATYVSRVQRCVAEIIRPANRREKS